MVTLEPTSCVVVTHKALQEHIPANPEFAFELLARVTRRACLATQGARGMALTRVYGRVTGAAAWQSRDCATRVALGRQSRHEVPATQRCRAEFEAMRRERGTAIAQLDHAESAFESVKMG